ncbi:MAG: ferritin-like domain-containing protein [Armatimonadota bacterium]
MSIKFNAFEILEIAEQIERNGIAFYSAAANAVSEPETKKLLQTLADWEISHAELFVKMCSELSEDDKAPMVFDPYDEMGMYLKSAADSVVFTSKMKPEEMLGPDPSPESVLQIALEREKDAVVFYAGIKDMVPTKAGRDKVDGVVKEEVAHVALIQRKLKDIQD